EWQDVRGLHRHAGGPQRIAQTLPGGGSGSPNAALRAAGAAPVETTLGGGDYPRAAGVGCRTGLACTQPRTGNTEAAKEGPVAAAGALLSLPYGLYAGTGRG